jgi:hypothetical protein
MVTINAKVLQKISDTASGHAMQIAIDGAKPEDISKALGSVPHRVLDCNDDALFDDKMATVVSGMEELSPTGFACFVSRFSQALFTLRFRNILIFPTKTWFEAEECELTAWERWNEADCAKFKTRISMVDLEGF